ncbi:exosortase Q [Variovorax dokdonensis]|uniref:Exosortase Q n=1 Tax=Variovorax dokdonensis TaxID=344883 RepID=A0ABT7NFN4_9BURK|nr:exosortase Q [Variovorax dokdonensis]MDM0046751.1 exosortase Q [Variovorax dokdonensis]
MNLSRLAAQHPRLFDGCLHIDRLPPLLWLALQAAALLPTWLWMARRATDGSDDPLGLLALSALGLLVWRERRALRAAPVLGWMAAAGIATLAATAMRNGLGPLPAWPPLVSALAAVLALAAGLLALLPRRVAAAPVLGLAVLALPLLASLQFYAGYPLRVVCAEASRLLLSPWFSHVQREGSSLLVDGLPVIVDAPCSGVQMAWFGYFVACSVALWCGLGNRAFMARLPVVGALVLVGNIVRNSLLIGLEGAGMAPSPAMHEAVGLAMLALVCAVVAFAMTPRTERRSSASMVDLTPQPVSSRQA